MQSIASDGAAENGYTYYFDTAVNHLVQITGISTVLANIIIGYWVIEQYDYIKRILATPIVEYWYSPEIQYNPVRTPRTDILLRDNYLEVPKESSYNSDENRIDSDYDDNSSDDERDYVKLPGLIRSYSKHMIEFRYYVKRNNIYTSIRIRSINRDNGHNRVRWLYGENDFKQGFTPSLVAGHVKFIIKWWGPYAFDGPDAPDRFDPLDKEEMGEAVGALVKKICATYMRNVRDCMMYIC